jgi:hypothetical protein
MGQQWSGHRALCAGLPAQLAATASALRQRHARFSNTTGATKLLLLLACDQQPD